MKNKKKSNNLNLLIFIIITLMIFIGIYLIYDNNYNVTFTLDEEEISIFQGEKINSSYKAYDNNGNPLNDVTIDDKVNYNTPGEYERCFTLKHGLYKKTLCQKVIVKENKALNYEIRLNGDSTVYVLVGNTYEDSGALVYEGSKEIAININRRGTIDTSKPGSYEITYYFDMNNTHKEVKRKVIVYELNYEITKSTANITSSDITIKVNVNSEYYSYTLLPDNSKKEENSFEYKVTSNGEYKFVIYDKFGSYREEIIKIDNIKREYKCNGVIDRKGTTLTVTGDGLKYINKYNYKLDNKDYDGKSTYNIYKIVNKASVTLTLLDNSSLDVDCKITNKLTYKFKYDPNNTKPYISCKTYTSQDKAKYDKILRDAINEVGIGTRAGNVEAARFLLGGLDYKIKYIGPKKYDNQLGSYNRVGLNIGQSEGWGCSKSGWTQGLDCTGFVSWVFKQNGLSIKGGIYGTGNTYKTATVVNRIKAGDLMLTPNNGSNPKKTGPFIHIGMVIGVDSNYIYVAESTTGTINALVVTRMDKRNLPTGGKFSTVRLYPYDGEGKYTDMWLD